MWTTRLAETGAGLLDLMVPSECGGCGRPGTLWCEACAELLRDHPVRLTPRVDPGVPVWALGRYSGPRRRSVIALKERGRRDLVRPLGDAVADGLRALRRWGELDPDPRAPLVLVPAPSRARAARARGGDPVRRIAERARERSPAGSTEVRSALGMSHGVRDSVGLSAAERSGNVRGHVTFDPTVMRTLRRDDSVVLLDDVLTTGATAAESVRILSLSGTNPVLVLVLAGA